jgi:F0F1-type ATP synthase membrane subunit b/b'
MKTPPAMFAGILLAIFAFFLLLMFIWNMVFPNAQPGVGG